MRTIPYSIKTTLLVLTALSLSATVCRAIENEFTWTNFESDIAGVALHTDPNLVNPWGMAASPSGIIWVNDNGAGVSTLYNQDGTPAPNSSNPLVVAIPPSASNTDGANPTGIVFNQTSFFKVTKNGNSQPSLFIFVSEDGSISGWNPQLDLTHAIIAVDNGATGSVYKGAALGVANGHNFLFVTNFHLNRVETYDENFVQVNLGGFVDPGIPSNFAPFGIRNFNGRIFVTYAKQKPPDNHDDLSGPGNGFVDVFDTTGRFIRRLISHGSLNSPWGLAMVQTFGSFHNALLVGNFGNGRINVYDPTKTPATLIGTPRKGDGTPLDFNGLWDLLPLGSGVYFSAGIADESHGLFGMISSEE
jgi:uncharacterized protein (TIGR03118 family)